MSATTNKELSVQYWKVVAQYCSALEKKRYYYRKRKIASYPVSIVQEFEASKSLDGVDLSDDTKFVLMLIFEKGVEEARCIYPEVVAERDMQFARSDNKLKHYIREKRLATTILSERPPRRLPTGR